MIAIFNKEFKSYFTSPIGYIFMGVFLLISGILFSLYNLLSGNSSYSSVLQSLVFITMLVTPILTMKIISEESRTKTDQLLYTAPIKLSEIVIGKYLAAVALFLCTLLVTFLYPLILSAYGSISWKEVLCNYLGFALMGCTFIAIGEFVSALTENQVVAAVGTFGILLLIWIADSISQSVPTTSNSGLIFVLLLVVAVCVAIYYATRNIFAAEIVGIIGAIGALVIFYTKKTLYEGLTAKILNWISFLKQFENFNIGMLSLASIVYFLSFIFIFVFLTIQVIEKRRWS